MRRPLDLGERLLGRVLIAFGGGLIAVAGVLAVVLGRLGDSRAASMLVGLALLVVALLACWLRSRLVHLVQFACVTAGLVAVGWYALTHLPPGTAAAPATTGNLTLPWALALAAVGLLVTTAGALTAVSPTRSRAGTAPTADIVAAAGAPADGPRVGADAGRDGASTPAAPVWATAAARATGSPGGPAAVVTLGTSEPDSGTSNADRPDARNSRDGSGSGDDHEPGHACHRDSGGEPDGRSSVPRQGEDGTDRSGDDHEPSHRHHRDHGHGCGDGSDGSGSGDDHETGHGHHRGDGDSSHGHHRGDDRDAGDSSGGRGSGDDRETAHGHHGHHHRRDDCGAGGEPDGRSSVPAQGEDGTDRSGDGRGNAPRTRDDGAPGRPSRTRVRAWTRRAVTAVAVATAIAVAVPVVTVVVPAQVAAANTSASTSSAPLPPAPKAAALAGKEAWRARFLADTAAGPVVARRHGFAVVDRVRGHVRWRYQRWDRQYPNSPAPSVVSSPDGRTLAALAVRIGDDGGRAGSEVQLFDAASGRLTHTWPLDDDAAVGAVLDVDDDGRVVLGARSGGQETVAAYTRAGRTLWSVPVDPGCAQGRRAAWTSRTLVLDCGDARLTALAQDTGRQRWTRTGADGRRHTVVSQPNTPTGVVLLSLTATDDSKPAVQAVDTDTGKRRWQDDAPACAHTVAGRDLVVTVTCAKEKPEPYGYEPASISFDIPGIDVVARDVRTGKVRWKRNLYGVHDTPVNAALPPAVPVTVLTDGRIVLAYLGLVINGFGMGCSLRTLSPKDGENSGGLQTLPQIGHDVLSRCGGDLNGIRGLVIVTATDGTQAAIR